MGCEHDVMAVNGVNKYLLRSQLIRQKKETCNDENTSTKTKKKQNAYHSSPADVHNTIKMS